MPPEHASPALLPIVAGCECDLSAPYSDRISRASSDAATVQARPSIIWMKGRLPHCGCLHPALCRPARHRSEEHTSELQSLMRLSYAVFCLKKKTKTQKTHSTHLKHRTNIHKHKTTTNRTTQTTH